MLFDGGGYAALAIKLVELNLFVWIIIALGITTATCILKQSAYVPHRVV